MRREPGIFYLADEKSLGIDGKIKTVNNVLHFKFPKTGFDGRADREHLKNFEIDFSQFMEVNPEYVSPWGEEPASQYVGGRLLKMGETVSIPVVKAEAVIVLDEAKSDDAKVREAEQPETGVSTVPESLGSESVPAKTKIRKV